MGTNSNRYTQHHLFILCLVGALYSASPATVRFSINGVQIGSTFTATTTIGGWTQFTANWTSGSGVTSADITIIDDNLAGGGNDFGLDDISFTASCTPSAQVTVTVSANPPPSASITPTNITSCFGATTGAATLSVSNGNAPYTYSWTGGATTQNLSGLAAGNYTVTVTDNGSCTAITSTTITQPAQVTPIASPINISCNGNHDGKINLSVIGGTGVYTYAWSNSATTQNISGLSVAAYTVTVNDAHSCSATTSASITQPAVLSSSVAWRQCELQRWL